MEGTILRFNIFLGVFLHNIYDLLWSETSNIRTFQKNYIQHLILIIVYTMSDFLKNDSSNAKGV